MDHFWVLSQPLPEAALERCSYKKVFWNYAANVQENSHAEVRFNLSEITLEVRLQSNFI